MRGGFAAVMDEADEVILEVFEGEGVDFCQAFEDFAVADRFDRESQSFGTVFGIAVIGQDQAFELDDGSFGDVEVGESQDRGEFIGAEVVDGDEAEGGEAAVFIVELEAEAGFTAGAAGVFEFHSLGDLQIGEGEAAAGDIVDQKLTVTDAFDFEDEFAGVLCFDVAGAEEICIQADGLLRRANQVGAVDQGQVIDIFELEGDVDQE